MSNYEVELTINNKVCFYREYCDIDNALTQYYALLFFSQQLDAPVELEIYAWHDDGNGSSLLHRYSNIVSERN